MILWGQNIVIEVLVQRLELSTELSSMELSDTTSRSGATDPNSVASSTFRSTARTSSARIPTDGASPVKNIGIGIPTQVFIAAIPPLVLAAVFAVASVVQSLPFQAPYAGLITLQAVFLVGLSVGLWRVPALLPLGTMLWCAILVASLLARLLFLASTRDRSSQETAIISRWDYTAAAVCFWVCAHAAWCAVLPPNNVVAAEKTSCVASSCRRKRCVSCLLSSRVWWTVCFLSISACAYPFFVLLPTLRANAPTLWTEQKGLVQSILRMQYLATRLTVPASAGVTITSPPPITYRSGTDVSVSQLSGTIYEPSWFNPTLQPVNMSGLSSGVSRGPWWVTHRTTMSRCLIWYDGNLSTLAIAFGGLVYSENFPYAFDATSIDWLPGVGNASDVDLRQTNGHSGGSGIVSVHRGFLVSYLALRDEIVGILRNELGHPPPQLRRFVISGHSMGAAVAGISTLDLMRVLRRELDMLPEVMAVLLYAPPHSGDSSFVAAYDSAVEEGQSLRLYAPPDIVGHILDPQVGAIFILVLCVLTPNAPIALLTICRCRWGT